jgi:hypothetical protein
VVGALHGPANVLNYDGYIWNKYQIGEWLNVIDPVTGNRQKETFSTAARIHRNN